ETEIKRSHQSLRGRPEVNPAVSEQWRDGSGLGQIIPGEESDNPAWAKLRSGLKAGQGGPQLFSMDLLLDAVVIGVLLGCFYAAVSLGLSVAFGLLDVPHVAHPAFLVLASYAVFFLNEHYGIDPLLAGLLITPLFFLFGLAAYRMYYETFEKRGSDAGVRGIAFFFGIAFIIEV